MLELFGQLVDVRLELRVIHVGIHFLFLLDLFQLAFTMSAYSRFGPLAGTRSTRSFSCSLANFAVMYTCLISNSKE